jgi:Predicted membrane protein (DUF2306)
MDLDEPVALVIRPGVPDRPPARPVPAPSRPAPLPPAAAPTRARAWWRSPWVLPWAAVAGWFLAISLPHYVGLDRSRTPVRLNPDYPLHYPLLVAHVTFGTVALVTACFQVWPWLREGHRAIHRWTGRAYVFAGVLPTGLLALAIMPFSQGPVGNSVAAVLWLATTVAGYRMIRRGREADHRRWMTYSFALTMQIVWGRVMFKVLPHVPGVNLGDPHTLTIVFEAASWIGIVVNLLIAQWWLERTARR